MRHGTHNIGTLVLRGTSRQNNIARALIRIKASVKALLILACFSAFAFASSMCAGRVFKQVCGFWRISMCDSIAVNYAVRRTGPPVRQPCWPARPDISAPDDYTQIEMVMM